MGRPLGSAGRSAATSARGRLVAVLAAVALLAAACSSGTDEAAPAPGGTTAAGRAALPECPLHALDDHDPAADPVEVVVWHFFAAKTEDALETLAEQYNASQSKVRVRVENQGTNNDEVWRKYLAGLPTGDLPAVAVLDDTVTRQVIDSGSVLPAQSCIDAAGTDLGGFLEAARRYYTVDGALYPASLNLSGALLYLNVAHFEAAGLDPTDPPATLEEVRRAAEALKASGVVDTPLVLNLGPPLIEMWLTGAGVPLVDNDNGRGSGTTADAAFDTPETVELYRWIKEMSDDGLLDALPDTGSQIGHYLAMANQKASMTIETSTAATSIEAFLGGQLDVGDVPDGALDGADGGEIGGVDAGALRIEAAAVPGLREPGRLQMGGGAWYLTDTGPPEVQAGAWDFLTFVNSVDSQVLWNTEGSYLPYNTAAADDPRVRQRWEGTLAGRWLAIAYDELTSGVDPDFPGPLIGPYDQFREAIRSSTDAMLFSGATPEEAVRRAADETTAALDAYEQGGF